MKIYDIYATTEGKGEIIRVNLRGASGEIHLHNSRLPAGASLNLAIHCDPDNPQNADVREDILRMNPTQQPESSSQTLSEARDGAKTLHEYAEKMRSEGATKTPFDIHRYARAIEAVCDKLIECEQRLNNAPVVDDKNAEES